ncbi:type VI secretion system baseplate subunit TssG, partial [Photobacterium sanctipauli]
SEELWRDKKTEQAKVAFLDIFNHRLFMLYWRAMANSQMITAVNRKHSLLTKLIDSAAVHAKTSGLSRGSVNSLQALPLWMKNQASVCSLRSMLSAALNVQVNVREFQPYWLKLERSDQTEVGIANSWLGHGMVLGSRVLTVTEAICIKLGPLSMEQYSTMTDPKNIQDVFHLIHSFMGRNLVIVLNIGVLIQSPTNLGEMRLGVNSWADSHSDRISWDYVQVS